MGQTSQEQQKIIEVGAVMGVDGTTTPYLLNPNTLVDCANFLPDQGYGGLTTVLGRGDIPDIGPVSLPGPVNGATIFHRKLGVMTPDCYMFALDIGGQGTLWALPVDGSGPLVELTLPNVATGSGLITVETAAGTQTGLHATHLKVVILGTTFNYADYTIPIAAAPLQVVALGLALAINAAPPITYSIGGVEGTVTVSAVVVGITVVLTFTDSLGGAFTAPAGQFTYYMDDSAAVGQCYDPHNADPANVTISFVPYTLTAGQNTSFAAAGVWMFMTNGQDVPLKIDEFLNVTFWGIQPPKISPTLAGASGGALSFGAAPYYYCVTFGHNGTGGPGSTDPDLESSQGGIAGPFTLGQTPGTANVVFSGTSGVPAKTPFQFVVGLGGAQVNYGAEYDAITTESDSHVARQIAALINSAPPLAYNRSGVQGTITVTATIDSVNNAQINLSFADDVGAALPGGYVTYYVSDNGSSTATPDQLAPGTVTGGSTQSAIALTGIPISLDPQVNQRNIYRLGGSLGQWRLIDVINDNTTTTFTDTIADSAVTGQTLVVFRDPPQRFQYICAHQQRIFGINIPADASQLWWSNYAEPWGFNQLQNVLEVGENLQGNPGRALGSIGPVLGIWKLHEFYALYGNSDATWGTGLFKIADVGIAAAASLVCAYGLAAWVSRQGAYMWDGNAPQNISDGKFAQSNIKNVFNQSTLAQLKNVTGFWYGRMVGFSFPNMGRTYMFDLRTQSWWPLSWTANTIVFDIESDVPVAAVRPGSDHDFDAWFLYGTDLDFPVVATGTTRLSGDPDYSWSKLLSYLLVDAPEANAKFDFVIVCDPGPDESVFPGVGSPLTTTQLISGFPRHRISLEQLDFIDAQLQFTLSSYTPGTMINRIGLYATLNREFAPEQPLDQ